MYKTESGETARQSSTARPAGQPFTPPCATRLVHGLLQLLQRQRLHCLRRRLCFEDTRLFGERIHSLASRRRWLDFELKFEVLADLETASLLQLAGANLHVRFYCALDVLTLHACRIRDGLVDLAGGFSRLLSLHSLHGLRLHGLHWRHGEHVREGMIA